MTRLEPKELTIGQELPAIVLPRISRADLALYAGASGDHNPMHIDNDFAKSHGFDDVYAQGMYPVASLGRYLTQIFAQDQLLEFTVRIVSPIGVHAKLTIAGVVRAIDSASEIVDIDVAVTDETGAAMLTGSARVAFDHRIE